MAGTSKLAILLQKRKICMKHREYHGLSLLLLGRQFTLILVDKLVVMLVLKLGAKRKGKLEFKLGVKLEVKRGVN